MARHERRCMSRTVLPAAVLGLAVAACSSEIDETTPPILVAHRGASAYAPEHTIASYELGIEQGADYIEPDLHITADGVLIAFHDLTLERTTDVEERFPDRYREVEVRGEMTRVWPVSDFDVLP